MLLWTIILDDFECTPMAHCSLMVAESEHRAVALDFVAANAVRQANFVVWLQ
jgi:hypothetical protein